MQQAIIGFHLDEEQHWVAELACGDGQHGRAAYPAMAKSPMGDDRARAQRKTRDAAGL